MQMTWRDEPVTDKQIRLIQDKLYGMCWKMRIYDAEELREAIQTKGKASELIHELDTLLIADFPDGSGKLSEEEELKVQQRIYTKFHAKLNAK